MAGDVARVRWARSRCGDALTDGPVACLSAAQWRLTGGKVLPASTSGTLGWRRARRRGQEHTREVRRCKQLWAAAFYGSGGAPVVGGDEGVALQLGERRGGEAAP
jgi:hypothetical protein